MTPEQFPSSKFTQTPEDQECDVRGEQVLEDSGNAFSGVPERPESGFLPLPDDELPLVGSEVPPSQQEIEDTFRRMVPIKEAAERVGIDPSSIRRIIRNGHARSETRPVIITQIIQMRYVSLDDLEAYRARVGNRGRPPKGRRR